jgi:hypothetical protein
MLAAEFDLAHPQGDLGGAQIFDRHGVEQWFTNDCQWGLPLYFQPSAGQNS